MKRSIKILSFAISLALIVCGIVFSFAANAAESEYDSGFSYTVNEMVDGVQTKVEKHEESDLKKVLTEVIGGTTIKMHADVTYDVGDLGESNSIARISSDKGGELVLDLGGHTLTVVQRAKGQMIILSSQNRFTIKNGTIKLLWADENNDFVDKSFPLFQLTFGNSQLVLEDVDTYSGSLIYAPYGAEDVKVTINGGTHYVMYGHSDILGGFVESRTAMLFTAEGAKFYITDKNSLLTSSSYAAIKYNYENPTKAFDLASTFRFNNCDIIAKSIDQNIIGNANEHTYIHFDNSRIFGSIGRMASGNKIVIDRSHFDISQPSLYGQQIAEIGEGQIILGPGTVYATMDSESNAAHFADGKTYGNSKSDAMVVVNASTNDAEDIESNVNYELYFSPESLGMGYDEEGNLVYNYDTSTKTDLAVTYDKKLIVPFYEIIRANGSSTTYNYGEKTLFEVVEEACQQAGSTVKLLYNVEIYAVGDQTIARFTNSCTLDLNGHTLSIYQIATSDEPKAESAMVISTTERVVITDSSTDKTGAIGAKRMNTKEAYPCFIADSYNSGNNFKIDIVFDDITFYGSSLIYIYNAIGSKVTVNGGEYNCLYTTTGSLSGFVQAVCDVDMVINDAVINLGDRGSLMASAARHISKTNAGSTYTFNNCIIVSSNASRVIFRNSNEFTRVAFNECYINGSMAPALTQGFDTSTSNVFGGNVKGPSQNSVTLDGSSWYTSGSSFTADIVSPKVGRFVSASELGLSNKTITYTLKEIKGDPVFYGFASGKATEKTLTLDKTVSPDLFMVSFGGVNYYDADDFTEAIELARTKSGKQAGAVVKFLGDYTITNGYKGMYYGVNHSTDNEYIIATVDFPLTIDLAGRTFSHVQGYLQKSGQETIKLHATGIVIKNGTIVTKHKTNASSYPIFTASANFGATLENITSYTGTIFYSYGNDGTFTITGGEHHIPYGASGSWGGGWFETHARLTFTANNTKFHVANVSGVRLIAAISNSYKKAMDYTFNNSDIIVEGANASIVRSANDVTSITFNNCRVKGDIKPVIITTNSAYNQTMISKITFGEGTVYSGTLGDGISVVTPDGYVYRKQANTSKVSIKITETPTVVKETVEGKEIGRLVIDPNRNDIEYSFAYAVLKGVNVSIKDESGAVTGTTTLLPGEAVGTLPTINPETVKTGYAKVTYTGNWVDIEGNIVTSETLMANSDMEIYPEVILTPWLESAMYNLQLMGHVKTQLLLPRADLPSDIKILSVNSWDSAKGTKGSAISGKNITFDGKTYTSYAIVTLGVSSIADEYSVVVTYTYEICGRVETLEQKISKISPISYAENILNDPTQADTGARPLVANLMRYSYYVCSLAGYYNNPLNVKEAYKKIANTYNSAACQQYCTDFNENWFNLPNNLANAESVLAEYVDWIKFDIETYQPKLKVKFKYNAGGVNVVDVKYEIVEGFKTGSGQVNWGSNLACQINANWGESFYDSEGRPVYRGNLVEEDSWTNIGGTSTATTALHISCPDNLEAYNIIRNIRITLTLSDGSTLSGVYNLRSYYNAMLNNDSLENKELVLDAICAIQAYSDMVAAYRFGPARDTNGWVSYDRANGYSKEN